MDTSGWPLAACLSSDVETGVGGACPLAVSRRFAASSKKPARQPEVGRLQNPGCADEKQQWNRAVFYRRGCFNYYVTSMRPCLLKRGEKEVED